VTVACTHLTAYYEFRECLVASCKLLERFAATLTAPERSSADASR
jgi:hypothetical protein